MMTLTILNDMSARARLENHAEGRPPSAPDATNERHALYVDN